MLANGEEKVMLPLGDSPIGSNFVEWVLETLTGHESGQGIAAEGSCTHGVVEKVQR